MQLANSIMLKGRIMTAKAFFLIPIFFSVKGAVAQSNSPYSRYGLGDAFPSSNITNRGMGGVTAGYVDYYAVNFNNPASYASFYAEQERKSKKLAAGRVVLDAGVNVTNRSLIAPNTTQRFTSSDAFFSYLQVGVPLRKNWGLSFGLRPLTKVSYKINRNERLVDPQTGQAIDSSITQFNGNGGSYLPSIGTGFGFGNFSAGINVGYMFGNKELDTRRAFVNDSVSYKASEHNTSYSFGGLFYSAGLQYRIDLKGGKNLRLGVTGNWKQNISGSQDILRQTFTLGTAGETLRIDSVFEQKDVKGDVVYPSNYTGGFVYSSFKTDGRGFLFGVDYSQSKWSEYRFFGQKDSVQDSWKLQVGGLIIPKANANSYFSRLAYRFGFSFGDDFVTVGKSLPTLGATFGLALPILRNRTAPNQINFVNLAFEFLKRGNNDNLLKENIFRVSAGFNFTDLWFIKRKYD